MWQQRSACRRIVLRYERRRELADDPIIDIETQFMGIMRKVELAYGPQSLWCSIVQSRR